MRFKVRRRDQNAPVKIPKYRVKKDDTVKVITGRDKGKIGRVLDVDHRKGQVLVEHMAMIKRHTRPNPQRQIQGGIAERESFMPISNVMVMTSGGVATRVGYRMEQSGMVTRRVRIAKKGGEILDKKA